MPPRKKPISQLAESTKKKNPSRVAKRTQKPLIISDALQVPSHFNEEQARSWAEVVTSYPGLNASHKMLVEIAANALLRTRKPDAKSSEFSFLHRITNQLQQAVIDYVPAIASAPSAHGQMSWELYEIRNKQRAEQLNAGTLSEVDFERLENEDSDLLTNESDKGWASFVLDDDLSRYRDSRIAAEMHRRKNSAPPSHLSEAEATRWHWHSVVLNELYPGREVGG